MQSSTTPSASPCPGESLSAGQLPWEGVPQDDSPPQPFLTPHTTPGPASTEEAMPALHGSKFGEMLRLLLADLHRLGKNASFLEEAWGLDETRIIVDGSVVDFSCPQRLDKIPRACSGGAKSVDLPAFPTCLEPESPKRPDSPKKQNFDERAIEVVDPQEDNELSHRQTTIDLLTLDTISPKSQFVQGNGGQSAIDLSSSLSAGSAPRRPIPMSQAIKTTRELSHTLYPKIFTIRSAWCEFPDNIVLDYRNSFMEAFSQERRSRTLQRLSKSGGHLPALKSKIMGTKNFSHQLVLHPSGRPRLIWNLACLIFIAYDIFAIPMMAFPISKHLSFSILNWMCTIGWTTDIVINFRTGYFIASHIEMQPVAIANNYMKSWMVPDLTIVGFEWFISLYDGDLVGGSVLRSARIWRVLRSVRLVRIAKMKNLWISIEHLVQSGMLHSMFGVFKLTALLMITVHIITCVWFAIGDNSTDGWVTHYSPTSPSPEDDSLFWYSASARWTLAQINGRTDMEKDLNEGELLYTCCIAFFVAVIFMAIFISSITTLMMDMATLVEHKTSLLRTVRNYLKRQKVSSSLMSSVHHSLAQEYEKENRIEEEVKVLGALPQHLAYDLLHEVRMSVMIGYEWFHAMNHKFPRSVRQLCYTASDLMCAHRDEVVFEKGDVCKRMLFIDHGMVEYDMAPGTKPDMRAISSDGTDQWRGSSNSSLHPGLCLRRGEWLSEAALWVEWTNQGVLRSGSNAGNTWLITVNMQEFAITVRQYEAAYAMCVLFAQQFVIRLGEIEVLSDLAMPPTVE